MVMNLKSFSVGMFSLIVTTGVALAGAPPLSQADVDAAVASVAKVEAGGLLECVKSAGTDIDYESEQIDLNKDGVNELLVRSGPKEYGKGATTCWGMVGQNMYLVISDGKGGWNPNLGFDTAEFGYHERAGGGFPDVELKGAGFCFPIWRFYKGEYHIWKACDDNSNLIYADTAKWVSDAAPRDAKVESATGPEGAAPEPAGAASAEYSRETDLSGPQFDHNGSLVVVDPKRGLIIYKKPKKSIAGTVKPGDVLFRGKPWDLYDSEGGVRGTAYVFRKGCAPAPYEVSGGQRQSWHTLVLRGEAPVRKKSGCDIASYTKTGGNSELVFDNVDD